MSMRHQDLTINHRLESWVYANTADRLAASGFVAGDIGRIAYQSDTGQFWRLTGIAPVTWQAVSPGPALAYAHLQTGQVSPAATSAPSPGVMMGLAGVITPTATGKIFATIAGTMGDTVANKTPALQMRFGTGSPPVNGAGGAPGTLIGAQEIVTGNMTNNLSPFSVCGVIMGAALGVPLWLDLQLWTSPGGIAVVVGASVSAFELP